jgi:Uma2 family endonuclease
MFIPTDSITEEEYLVREPEAEYKSEYRAGKVVAMAGASERHVTIVTNLVREFSSQLKQRPCKVYASDMRLHVPTAGLYTYPDLMIVCGKPEMVRGREDTLLNPVVIVEVLSNSTEAYDRGLKFEFYKRVEALRDYVLVAQDRTLVEHLTRDENGAWKCVSYPSRDNSLALPAIDCNVTLREVYDKVDFNP